MFLIFDKSKLFFTQTTFFKQDKHLKNRRITESTGFGEAQIAAEMLACGNENIREIYLGKYAVQEMFAVRVISTYVTFYRTVISTSYWKELGEDLPQKQSVVIERWPRENGIKTGLNLVEPKERKDVITAFIKIRQYILHQN